MSHQPEQPPVGDDPDRSMQLLIKMHGELAAFRNAFRVEIARSDFLFDRALRRHVITEDEYAFAQDPERLANDGE